MADIFHTFFGISGLSLLGYFDGDSNSDGNRDEAATVSSAVGAHLSDTVVRAVDSHADTTDTSTSFSVKDITSPSTSSPAAPTVRRRYIAINPTYALPEDTVERYGLRYRKLPKA